MSIASRWQQGASSDLKGLSPGPVGLGTSIWMVGREYGSVPSINKNDDRVFQKPRIKDQCLKQRALELW